MSRRSSISSRKKWQKKVTPVATRLLVGRKRNRWTGSWFSLLPIGLILGALWWLVRQPRQGTSYQRSDDWQRVRAPGEGRSDSAGQAQAERIRPAERPKDAGQQPAEASDRSAAPQGEPSEEDDLVKIEGIGPKTAGVLREAGIYNFTQLAEADLERLKEILRNADMRGSDPSTWPEQARLAAKGDWEGLAALRDELQGGRRVD